MAGTLLRGNGEGCLYLVKESDDLVSWCECSESLVSLPGQMDCPWCGCGWLFSCLSCRKAFAFARASYVPRSLESIAQEDLRRFGEEPTEDLVGEWLAGMTPMLETLKEGVKYVYLDGYYVPVDSGPIEIAGIHSNHRFDQVPQVAALDDSTVIEEILGNPAYWEEGAASPDENSGPAVDQAGAYETVHLFDASDPEFVRATERARETFKYLLRELAWEQRRIVPALDFAAVKMPFPIEDPTDDQPPVEHMWIGDLECDGDLIAGTLLNSPRWVDWASQGDPIEGGLEDLSDWMLVADDRVYGAFTVQLMRSRMAVGERREHDEAWGFEFGDPETVRLVPSPAEENADQSAEEHPPVDHPMSLNMEDSLRQHLIDSPGFALERDDDGWTMLHSEALTGNRNIVKVLLEFGADPAAETNDGRTARDLAESLGWSEVVELLDQSNRS